MRRAFFELGFYGMQVADPSNFLCSNDGWIELTCFVVIASALLVDYANCRTYAQISLGIGYVSYFYAVD